jgi:hypothetical protein
MFSNNSREGLNTGITIRYLKIDEGIHYKVKFALDLFNALNISIRKPILNKALFGYNSHGRRIALNIQVLENMLRLPLATTPQFPPVPLPSSRQP